ncbi:16S rRNA (cytidine(1402)-2'-O)-methyltransferase [Camelliibacillus cellulosilyticus]|uniref:Ribosomal RNA small subunit methyltransferase I n=1 Tax=Camelliibacillus cellulosilyticus TaxID=2174486 RepID=A0ABV9GS20_9BACL
MREQNSFKNNDAGVLYVIPTPIGNLDDMTIRALNVLKSVDVIAAEDTRHTLKLCRHFEVGAPLTSYHEHNKKASGPKLIEKLMEGQSVGLVSDAGMPGISDPGADLAAECIDHGIPVVPLPGPNAAVTALVASGLSTDHFLFWGFLPRQKKDRAEVLDSLKAFPHTLIFYEAPHRLKDTLSAIQSVFGDRLAALARELTKRHETFLRGRLSEIEAHVAENEVKGECCLIVEGGTAEKEIEWWRDLSINDHVDHYIKIKGYAKKDAIKQTAVDRSESKRIIYNAYHGQSEG